MTMSDTTANAATGNNNETSAKCVELALDGERRCRAGDTAGGIEYLKSALAVGTDDLRTLSAIYSQLGNAFFYQGDYNQALEYHRHDLTLARTIGDKIGEAKASGNLGNTLKVLEKFDEAILCCQRHLEISRSLNDKVGEGRALYNLGNVYHAKGKHLGRLLNSPLDTSTNSHEFPNEISATLNSAVEYYQANLRVVKELQDRAAQGRACGNLGNSFYLLGQFEKAIQYHELRLQIAKEFGDKVAMRRAYSNLGNAHVFLGDFVKAAECYKKALAIALELGDRATEAQACYSLGNTSTLIGDHTQAVEYHLRHLSIARDLKDRVGQSRASWSLGNAFSALDEYNKALYFVMLHRHLSKEIGDQNGHSVAETTLNDLSRVLGPLDGCVPDSSADPQPQDIDDIQLSFGKTPSECGSNHSKPSRRRRSSMERMQTWNFTHNNALQTDDSSASKHPLSAPGSSDSLAKNKNHLSREASNDREDDESFMDMLARVQGTRINDQRCDPSAMGSEKENRPRVRAHDGFRQDRKLRRLSSNFADSFKKSSTLGRRFSTALSGAPKKARRRISSVFRRSDAIGPNFDGQDLDDLDDDVFKIDAHETTVVTTVSAPNYSFDASDFEGPAVGHTQTREEFWDMISGIQGRRMDDQRAQLPSLPGLNNAARVLGPHIRRQSQQQDAQVCASGAPIAKPESDDGKETPDRMAVDGQAKKKEQIDDDFIEMLIRCQSTRLDEQRSELPEQPTEAACASAGPAPPAPPAGIAAVPPKLPAPTVPDEDFFSLIMKMQGNRFEEQRAPLVKSVTLSSAAETSSKQPHKRTASQKLKNKQ